MSSDMNGFYVKWICRDPLDITHQIIEINRHQCYWFIHQISEAIKYHNNGDLKGTFKLYSFFSEVYVSINDEDVVIGFALAEPNDPRIINMSINQET